MAKFVIAGKADCPYYAKAELLGDQLSRNLPDFKIHKIVKNPADWDVIVKPAQVVFLRGKIYEAQKLRPK